MSPKCFAVHGSDLFIDGNACLGAMPSKCPRQDSGFVARDVFWLSLAVLLIGKAVVSEDPWNNLDDILQWYLVAVNCSPTVFVVVQSDTEYSRPSCTFFVSNSDA